MDADASWQVFAGTGNILRYLDYKQQAKPPAETAAGDTGDGNLCNNGPGIKRDPL